MKPPSGITKLVTITVMFACAAALIVWDVFVATNKVAGDTISDTTIGFASRYPIAVVGLGLAAGIILGNLLWPQYPDEIKKAIEDQKK